MRDSDYLGVSAGSIVRPTDHGESDSAHRNQDGRADPFRVAYVIQNAANDLADDVGQAILIKRTVAGLQRAGHTVCVFRLSGREVVCIDDLAALDRVRRLRQGWSGNPAFKVIESGVRRVQRELQLPYLALFDSFRFYEACGRHLPGYDLCHEYGGLFSLGAALACRRRGIPYILTVEADAFLENEVKGTPIRGLQAEAARRISGFAYRSADRIITVSEPARRHIGRNWRLDLDKIVVLPNGVDTNLFSPDYDPGPIRAELGLHTEPVIAFVGGFQPWHGIGQLVESFRRVLERRPAARLLLVGDGPIRPDIERQIARLGIGTKVLRTGLVPQRRAAKLLRAADVAVMPYPELPRELWFSPLKLFEYMASGRAIIASRAGQIATVIDHGISGVLVEPGNVEDLAQAIVALIDDPDRRAELGRNARRQAVERHSWVRYIQRLEAIYRSVAGNPDRGNNQTWD